MGLKELEAARIRQRMQELYDEKHFRLGPMTSTNAHAWARWEAIESELENLGLQLEAVNK